MPPRLTRRAALGMLTANLAGVPARAQPTSARTSPPTPPPAILFREVRIFDGIGGGLRPGHVLVSGDKIGQISTDPISPLENCTVIEGGGRVLMPGLSDAHWHMVFAPNTMADMVATDTGLMYANAVAEAKRTLMRGFTTIRDTGGRRLA